ncbi:MAG: hypothetical protein HC877_16300 [Thioploca sp.]|nr:hypothetical protein [Thioploca sp.]
MQLDQIGVVIRPRNQWEAIDLGFSMVRLWWKSWYKIWFILIPPVFITTLGLFLLNKDLLWLAAVINWWLKPLFDRLILYFLSHAVFGEQPSIRQTLTNLPTLLFKTQLGLALTIGRFDLARSFNLSVWQLEELRGKIAVKRMKHLQNNTHNTAVWLTIVCIHFEWLLNLSLFILVYWMIPVSYKVDLFEVIVQAKWWLDILTVFFNFLVFSIIEPIYVAAGFALYLNRRTHLEGWDIELAFRRIAARLTMNSKN